MNKFIGIVVIAALAGAAGWFIGSGRSSGRAQDAERKVAFYQSPMHPWIKSDQPGNCTICGMKLTPIFEGEKGFEVEGDIVTLSSNSINVLNVQTAAAEVRPIDRELRVAGRIEADETKYRVISAYVDGRIEGLSVNFVGFEVRQGQPLARLYSPMLQTAQREYLQLLAQTNFAITPQLRSEHDRMVGAARTRLARLGLTAQQIGSLGSSNDLFTTEIVAPISGTVVKREVYEGQYVKEGDKLFEISDLSTMWFRFEVYEHDLPLISPGQTVRVTTPALGQQVLEGPIVFIEPTLNDATRSARVRVELPNPSLGQADEARRALYNGLYAEGAIRFSTQPVLAVPESAVLHPGDHPRVYVEQSTGAYEPRVVQIGRRGSGWWEITDGLDAGEKVVINGNLLIDSQAQINRTGSSPAHDHSEHSSSSPAEQHVLELTESQKISVDEFVEAISVASSHLANDDATAYNNVLPRIADAAERLSSALGTVAPVQPILSRLAAELPKLPQPELEAARLAFMPFSSATTDLIHAFRGGNPGIHARIYKCPMYPARGKTAYWVQRDGPLRNPFYGSEMLECGEEVR